MPPNKYKLIAIVVITGLIGALKAIVPLEPAWSWITSAVMVLTAVVAYLVVPGTPAQVAAHADAAPGAKASVPPVVVGLLSLLFALCLVASVPVLAMFVVGCTPAQSAAWSSIENAVLQQLQPGSVLSTIEAAVIPFLPAAVAADVAAVDDIIDAAIVFLEKVGALTPAQQAAATSIHGEIAVKKASRAVNAGQGVVRAIVK
jgi:hypothetical protein